MLELWTRSTRRSVGLWDHPPESGPRPNFPFHLLKSQSHRVFPVFPLFPLVSFPVGPLGPTGYETIFPLPLSRTRLVAAEFWGFRRLFLGFFTDSLR